MTETEIPADVMKTVAKAVGELDDTIWKNGEECGVSHGLAGRVLVRLILEERERCAKVAEKFPSSGPNDRDGWLLRKVANAIRHPVEHKSPESATKPTT